MKNSLCIFLLGMLMLSTSTGVANNISVTNVYLTGQNTGDHHAMVQFTLAWENSWRTSSAPNNWDAAWVFVKYRVGSGAWQHAWLNDIGNVSISGGLILDVGLLTPGTAFNATTNPGLGAFLYRAGDGTGSITNKTIQLRWNYGANGVVDGASVDIKVFAIEMVYVPVGTFALGSGSSTETAHFYQYPTTTATYSVSTEAAITVGNTSGNLYYPLYIYGGDQAGPIPAAFPKGYAAFYCMKHEISQQGYVDFLNTLTYSQQATRTGTANPAGVAGTGAFTNSNRFGIDIQTSGVDPTTPAVYACNLNGNGSYGESVDGQWIACNQIRWTDVTAYLDWSGLRPMTELEFEKACRGTLTPVADEYAWGTTGIASSAYTLSNSGATDEVIATGYSTSVGNAAYVTTVPSNGPLRVGVFAGTSGNTGRITAGATYYGIMEMTGNLWEVAVSVGSPEGRAFTGIHGDGALATNGDANSSFWPGGSNSGFGLRGGGMNSSAPTQLRVSYRESAAYPSNQSSSNEGGRGVRTAFAPVIGQTYGGGIIFYIDGTGQHGLIAAGSDQSAGAQWGCYGTGISGADGTALGTGNQNTIDIEAGCATPGTAADICANLSLNGYDDWYLPSKDELNNLYLNQGAIGDFSSVEYWSSSEISTGYAWLQRFDTGSQFDSGNKGHAAGVRAIRAF